jgi:hypothetical protein
VIWRTPSRTRGSSLPPPREIGDAVIVRLAGGGCLRHLRVLAASLGQPREPNCRQASSISPLANAERRLAAPSTASSGATIAIASERGVAAASFGGYPIVELSCSAFRTSCGPERASSTPPAYTDPKR